MSFLLSTLAFCIYCTAAPPRKSHVQKGKKCNTGRVPDRMGLVDEVEQTRTVDGIGQIKTRRERVIAAAGYLRESSSMLMADIWRLLMLCFVVFFA